MKSYQIMGCDPGILNTGFAIVNGNSKYKLIASEHVKTDPSKGLGERLAAIQTFVNKINSIHPVDAIAIEKCFHNRNVSSSASTQQVIGAIHIMAYALKIPVIELTPQAVKKASGLSSKANKANLIRAANGIFNSKIKSHHTADAALCALAAILQTRCNHAETT